ncbi:MAG: hypothetical protein PHY85_02965 [Bacteroidales bacterium]|nr:hypothetical protein [Bacteroidales bacterium]
MTKEFLLHKDKEKGIPPHIQAHLSLPDTKANASQSQKSLHFANPLKLTHSSTTKTKAVNIFFKKVVSQ